jgi:hypothetical protein
MQINFLVLYIEPMLVEGHHKNPSLVTFHSYLKIQARKVTNWLSLPLKLMTGFTLFHDEIVKSLLVIRWVF